MSRTAAEQKVFFLLANTPAVSNLVGNRIYPIQVPQSTEFPHIVYFRVSGTRINSLDGDSGLENPRIQIDCLAETYAGAQQLRAAVLDAMNEATTFKSLNVGDRQFFDEAPDAYRVSLDFSVWNGDME